MEHTGRDDLELTKDEVTFLSYQIIVGIFPAGGEGGAEGGSKVASREGVSVWRRRARGRGSGG